MIQRTACLIGRSDDIFYNQAVEMQLMDTLPRKTAMLFLYESKKAVLQGRMEDSREVCRRKLLEDDGGRLCRRVSGGSTQYAAKGVLCYSLLLPKEEFLIPRQMEVLGRAVQSLGIPVAPGRSTFLGYGGRYYLNSAFYKTENAAIHHGTIFCDADLGHMALYLTNGIAESSINLRSLRPHITIPDLEEALFDALGMIFQSKPVWLDEHMLDQDSIQELALFFQHDKWVNHCSDGDGFLVSEHFPWGNVTVQLKEKNGLIDDINIFTNAHETDWFAFLEQSLIGAPFLISSISGRWVQRMEELRDSRLLQITGDLITLICGHIKQSNRRGERASSLDERKENENE